MQSRRRGCYVIRELPPRGLLYRNAAAFDDDDKGLLVQFPSGMCVINCKESQQMDEENHRPMTNG